MAGISESQQSRLLLGLVPILLVGHMAVSQKWNMAGIDPSGSAWYILNGAARAVSLLIIFWFFNFNLKKSHATTLKLLILLYAVWTVYVAPNFLSVLIGILFLPNVMAVALLGTSCTEAQLRTRSVDFLGYYASLGVSLTLVIGGVLLYFFEGNFDSGRPFAKIGNPNLISDFFLGYVLIMIGYHARAEAASFPLLIYGILTLFSMSRAAALVFLTLALFQYSRSKRSLVQGGIVLIAALITVYVFSARGDLIKQSLDGGRYQMSAKVIKSDEMTVNPSFPATASEPPMSTQANYTSIGKKLFGGGFGAGTGTYVNARSRFDLVSTGGYNDNADNTVVWLYVNTGYIGLILVIGAFIFYFIRHANLSTFLLLLAFALLALGQPVFELSFIVFLFVLIATKINPR